MQLGSLVPFWGHDISNTNSKFQPPRHPVSLHLKMMQIVSRVCMQLLINSSVNPYKRPTPSKNKDDKSCFGPQSLNRCQRFNSVATSSLNFAWLTLRKQTRDPRLLKSGAWKCFCLVTTLSQTQTIHTTQHNTTQHNTTQHNTSPSSSRPLSNRPFFFITISFSARILSNACRAVVR